MCAKLDLEEVVTAFRQGDKEAFQQLHKVFFPELFRFCKNLLENEQEAEDIASDTMFKLYQKRKDFTSVYAIRAFLYISARNSCMSYFRKSKRAHTHKMKILPTLPVEQTTEDILDGLYYEALRTLLHNYLKQLPEKQQEVIDLLFIQDHSLQEVADKMSVTVSAIKQHRHRALHRLREILKSSSFIEGLTLVPYIVSLYFT
ncbi:RNA polymerase sigma factor [Chitinophaga tropicalis]|uniref:Sigma-70 family RNA polymerase sigma factor n=1 Tax=Chitinophaga tropicalis TaxID=2683588 RepID=A0A7K1U038_9BACT|nr:RNA polymerase sigma factor [Chitinophaga tropicalis]MVT07660.1 sigma-70 family RNA polymerase sigma factor [Chitinophaga tropicalis]